MVSLPSRDVWPELVARAQADSHWRRPDSRVVLSPSRAEVDTPSSHSPLFNNVRLAVFGEQEADDEIHGLITRCVQRGSGFAWVVGPLCRPPDLAERLVRHGMVERGESWGMVMEGARFEAGPTSAGVEIKRVSAAEVDDVVEVSERGFGRLPSVTFREDVLSAMDRHPGDLRIYVAYVEGAPVGAGMTRLFPQCALLIGSSVVPGHRRRGIYRALLAQRIHDAVEAGVGLIATVAASATSGPICARVGFERVCTFRAFTLP